MADTDTDYTWHSEPRYLEALGKSNIFESSGKAAWWVRDKLSDVFETSCVVSSRQAEWWGRVRRRDEFGTNGVVSSRQTEWWHNSRCRLVFYSVGNIRVHGSRLNGVRVNDVSLQDKKVVVQCQCMQLREGARTDKWFDSSIICGSIWRTYAW